MKILIVNQHTNNFGDDAAGVALVNCLLKIDKIEKIELLYCMPGFLPIEDKRVIHNHWLDVRKLRRIEFLLYYFVGIKKGNFIPGLINKLKKYDLVLVSPCGSNLGIYKDWQLLFQDLVVVRNKKKLIFHLNTIAGSGNWIFDMLVRKLCKKSYVYVREKASQRYLEKRNIHTTWGPDSAFLLESKGDIVKDSRKIAFIPSDVWSWHVNFKDETNEQFDKYILTQLVYFARNNCKDIYILNHTNSADEKIFNAKVKKKIENLDSSIRVVLPKIKTVYDYENMIRESYLVVGMRYHAIVLAAKNAIPFVSISYEQKMKEVSEYTNQSIYCIDLKKIKSEETISKMLNSVKRNYRRIQEELNNKRCELIKQAAIVIQEQIITKD